MLITPETRIHEFKAVSFATETKVLGSPDEGIVQAIVNVTANRDSDGDVVVPGATQWGINVLNPKGARFHDKTRVVARTLEAVEVMPGDKSLPQALLDMGVGGLRVTGQYNLKSADGQEAFESIRFFGDEQEWSVGYEIGEYFVGGGQTRVGKDIADAIVGLSSNPTYQALMQKNLAPGSEPSRFITKWITFEWSDVMFGANALTGTEQTKDATRESELVKELEHIRVRMDALDGGGEKATLFDGRVKDLEEGVAHLHMDVRDDAKAGRVQARRNEARLRAVRDAVTAMLDEIRGEDAEGEVADGDGKSHVGGLAARYKMWVDAEMEGTYEDTQDDLREALCGLFNPTGVDGIYVSIQGTYPDHVVCQVCKYGGSYEDTNYDVPWQYGADGETIELGQPTEIEVTISIAPVEDASTYTPAPKNRKDAVKNHDFTPSMDNAAECSDCQGAADAAWHNDDKAKSERLEGEKAMREFATIAAERGLDALPATEVDA